MKITKIQFKNLVSKIVSSLTKHFNDPKVINYNFYDNTSGVGVKMVRKTNRITVNDLAIKLNDLATKLNDLALVVYNLTLEVRAGFAEQKKFNEKQEVFNQEVRDFMKEQKVFNKNQEEFNNKLLSLPTIKKEMAELEANKN